MRAVAAARRQLVLVMPEQVAGARCEPHPLLDELVARFVRSDAALEALTVSPDDLARGVGLAGRLERISTEAVAALPLPAGRRHWQVDPGLIRPRDAESASSLERLVGCPLSWALHYQAGLRSASRGGIPTGPLLAGKLGHRLLEELHRASALTGEVDEVRQRAEQVLDGLLEREAATLLVAGTSDDRLQRRSELVEAAASLVALLREAELEVTGCTTCSRASRCVSTCSRRSCATRRWQRGCTPTAR